VGTQSGKILQDIAAPQFRAIVIQEFTVTRICKQLDISPPS
jgi:hypothetical protein